jgi:hypothetical protein
VESKALLRAISLVIVLALVPVYAVAGSSVTLHVYSDNSVSVSGEYVEEAPGANPGTFSAVLTVTDDMFKVNVSFFKSGDGAAPGTQMLIHLHAEQKPSGTRTTASITGTVSVWDDRGKLTFHIKNVEYEVDTTSYTGRISGTVDIHASGEAASIIPQLSVINKEMLQQALQGYGVEGVEIRELNAVIHNETHASVSFVVDINLNELQVMYANYTQQAFVEGLRNLAVPATFDLDAEITQDKTAVNAVVTVSADINEVLKAVSHMLVQLPSASPEVSREVDEEFLGVLAGFSKTFRILPSTGKITVTTIPSGVKIAFHTPRIVKIGAKSPEDTIKALYTYAVKLINTSISGGRDISDVLDTRITLMPEENVKVSINGTPATEISFKDLPQLKVSVKKPATTPLRTTTRTTSTAQTAGATSTRTETRGLTLGLAIAAAAGAALILAIGAGAAAATAKKK